MRLERLMDLVDDCASRDDPWAAFARRLSELLQAEVRFHGPQGPCRCAPPGQGPAPRVAAEPGADPVLLCVSSPFGADLSVTLRPAGGRALDPERLAECRLLLRYAAALLGPARASAAPGPRAHEEALDAMAETAGLTEREREILGRMAEGMALRAISAELGCSYGTVRWHVQNILSKTGAHGQRALLARLARRN